MSGTSPNTSQTGACVSPSNPTSAPTPARYARYTVIGARRAKSTTCHDRPSSHEVTRPRASSARHTCATPSTIIERG